MTRTVLRCVACTLTVITAGCSALDVTDPTAVEETELANASGAELMRRDALSKLYAAVAAGAIYSGLLTDEFFADPGVRTSEEATDRREGRRSGDQPGSAVYPYEEWQRGRLSATAAMERLQAYAADAVRRPHIGQMRAARGFAILGLVENFCPGFPLNEVVDGRPAYRSPVSTDAALAHALADFDSALAYATDSVRIANLARVGQARTLMALGRFADAAAAAAPVPTEFVWNAEYAPFTSGVDQSNLLSSVAGFTLSRSVADREGVNGLDFVSASDPRVPTTFERMANDGVTAIYAVGKYPVENTPIVLASGLEARLVEAEAALRVGDATWLVVLNDLRATQISPPLPTLDDPKTPESRVDLLFRERAFWLFASGHRLSGLRRLTRHYGRAAETVFPTGRYRLGGDYGTITSLPFPAEAERNPSITGCTDS